MACLTILVTIIVLGALIKLFVVLNARRNKSFACLVGKTAIVTGANTGIGFHTALDFAKRGARVILACRDHDKATKAKNSIIQASGNENICVKTIDMASLASVRDFAKDVNENEDRIDILVNNAGASYLGNTFSKDGLQLLTQINHFSNFLLTNLLIDKLKKSAPSRIVNVSSYGAKFAEIDPNKLNAHPKDFLSEFKLYCNTKLLNILFTNELARKLEGSQVTANSLHPGLVKTELNRNLSKILLDTVWHLVSFYSWTPEEGAQTTLYVALSKDIQNVSGKYFDNCRQAEMFSPAKDVSLCRKVWEKSAELVKLTDEEKRI